MPNPRIDGLRVEYINNFETNALDAVRDMAAKVDRADITLTSRSFARWAESEC